MDKRIKYRIVMDTETCPIEKDLEEVNPNNMLVYDIGWVIADKRGRVYETHSYVVREIFIEQKELMKSAYYADKIPNYWKEIKEGKRQIRRLKEIYKILKAEMVLYDVDELYAHNARFDVGSLNNTIRFVTKDEYYYFLPSNLTICDTLKMARDVILKMPTYRRFCEENNYICKNKQLKATAEVLHRFLSGDNTFEESHTGLEDVLIEKDIMAYCFRSHKKMRRVLYEKRV